MKAMHCISRLYLCLAAYALFSFGSTGYADAKQNKPIEQRADTTYVDDLEQFILHNDLDGNRRVSKAEFYIKSLSFFYSVPNLSNAQKDFIRAFIYDKMERVFRGDVNHDEHIDFSDDRFRDGKLDSLDKLLYHFPDFFDKTPSGKSYKNK